MIVKLLTEYHLECLSLKGGCRDSLESTHLEWHIVGNLMHGLKCVLRLPAMYLFICSSNHYLAAKGWSHM